MAERKAFLLRVDPTVLEALQRWANSDLRSLNAQIEFVLRQALKQAGRQKASPEKESPGDASGRGATEEGGHPQG